MEKDKAQEIMELTTRIIGLLDANHIGPDPSTITSLLLAARVALSPDIDGNPALEAFRDQTFIDSVPKINQVWKLLQAELLKMDGSKPTWMH